MPGFPENDHRRVCDATIWVERNRDNRRPIDETRAPPRGLVRVMLLEDVSVDTSVPTPTKGDLPLDARSVRAVITDPTTIDFGGTFHYVVRCVAADTAMVPRTWQLRVSGPDGDLLTSNLQEHATADQVRDAINATGCPECEVAGLGRFAIDEDDNQVELPGRQWHIYWPESDWTLSTLRPIEIDGETDLEYAPGDSEVPIALFPTLFAPTADCETVWLPFQRSFAVPTPGTFALCQVLPSFGLVVTEAECWSYVD